MSLEPVMNVVVKPSSISPGLDLGVPSHRDRQRQLASNQKAERVFGTPVPASYLKHGIIGRSTPMKDGVEGKAICLNSPVSKCPTSFMPWNSCLLSTTHAATTVGPSAVDESARLPTPAAALTTVPPLNFKRRSQQRRSLSMAKIETEMTDYKRDAAPFLSDLNTQADSHPTRPGETCITRRQSLPDTRASGGLPSVDGASKRHPRPLPPVPSSRPASPTSSNSSHNSHSGPRPLPNPPFRVHRVPVPSVTPSMLGPVNKDSEEADSTLSPTKGPLRVSVNSRRESDMFSPLSPLSIITDLPRTLRIPTAQTASPRSSESRKRHRIHASPYKMSRGSARYSTTSLSSQVSVPPVPSPAEQRRRNREKMAKLIRVLGESPPSHMVFATERKSDESEDTIEESVESTDILPITVEPFQRSVSLGLGDYSTSLFGKKKALSDPDAGHGVRIHSPTSFGPQSPKPTSFLRRRSKRGRADKDNVPRYVVSLFDTAESKTSERLTFKLHAEAPKMRPAGSYLRGGYREDIQPADTKTPPLPKRIPGIDLPNQTPKWVRDSRQNRWEVDDYENVVASLRKL